MQQIIKKQETNTHGDGGMICGLQEQERALLVVQTDTSGSFTNQPRPSTSGFIVSVSRQPVVASSLHETSTRDRELFRCLDSL